MAVNIEGRMPNFSMFLSEEARTKDQKVSAHEILIQET